MIQAKTSVAPMKLHKAAQVRRAFHCLVVAGLLSFGLAASASTFQFEGREVDDDVIIMRLMDHQEIPAVSQTLRNGGYSIKAEIATVPGLILVAPAAGAVRAQSDEARSNALRQRIDALKATGKYLYVEPNYIYHTTATPSDAAFQDGRLWGLRNIGQNGGLAGADITVTNAWDFTTGDTNVIVAIVDTGVRYTHQDLLPNMWVNPGEIPGNNIDDDNDGYVDNIYGADTAYNDGDPMDVDGHGTHVAGTVGAVANNAGAHVGVAWNVRLMAIKAAVDGGGLPLNAIVQGIDFAARHGAKVMNHSYGGYGFSQAQYDVMAAAGNRNILHVCAAGNESNNNDTNPAYPASYDLQSIISVAATERTDLLANFSNYGALSVDLGAPGTEIFSTWSDSDSSYNTIQGTSMASPHVAGVAALMASFNTNITIAQFRAQMLDNVTPTPALAGRTASGGRVNAFRAVTLGVDGVLEINVNPASGSEIAAGRFETITATVTDGLAVTNATLEGRIFGLPTLTFRNDGVFPDVVATDSLYTAQLNVPPNTNRLTMELRAGAPGKSNAVVNLNYFPVFRPANDDFSEALKIQGARFVHSESTRFATRQLGEPQHAGLTDTSGSIWYTWSLPQAARVIVDTAGSTFDSAIAVYTGNSIGALTPVASVDNVGNSAQPYLQFDASANVAYRVAIFGARSADAGLAKIRFEINGLPDTVPPLLTVFSPPSGLVVTTNRIQIVGASNDPTPNASGVQSVSMSVNGGIPFTVNGTTNWSASVGLTLGENVIRVTAMDEARNESLDRVLTIHYRLVASSNDHFANAIPLESGGGTSVATSQTATKEFNEPAHASNGGGKSIWYRFTPQSSGILLLSTDGSDFDTLLALYTGSKVSALTPVASNDDVPGGSKQSEIIVAVAAGTVYHIAVDGYDAASGTVRLLHAFSATTNYRVSTSSGGNGQANPSSGLYPAFSTVSLSALPDPYYQFSHWETPGGVLVSRANPFNLLIHSDTNLTARFSPKLYTDDFESGDLTRLPWQSSPESAWGVVNFVRPNGQFVASVGSRPDRSTSSLVLPIQTAEGRVRFDLRVSSEANYDKLSFVIDDVVRRTWSGEVPWSTFDFEIAAGAHRIEWRYIKDAALSAGLDSAFIDNLEIPVQILPPTLAISLQINARILTIAGSPGAVVQMEASSDLLEWSPLGTVVLDNVGNGSLTDSVAGVATRYYRARLQ